jgi:hypothetical protein
MQDFKTQLIKSNARNELRRQFGPVDSVGDVKTFQVGSVRVELALSKGGWVYFLDGRKHMTHFGFDAIEDKDKSRIYALTIFRMRMVFIPQSKVAR